MDAWYVMVWGQEHGPVTMDGLRLMADTGRLRRKDQIRLLDGKWVDASTIAGLFPIEAAFSEADTVEMPIVPPPKANENRPG